MSSMEQLSRPSSLRLAEEKHTGPLLRERLRAVVSEELVARLRRTAEWTYIEREVDIRLVREPSC
jgi:hypothetical protein